MKIIRAADMALSATDLERAAAKFDTGPLVKIGGYENLLFRSADREPRVLRLTHATRRSIGMIEAELHFMEHLAANGVPVVVPVRAKDGSLVAELDTESGDSVLVACTTNAPGSFRPRTDWSKNDIVSYGAVLGAMHAAAGGYEPQGPTRRPTWDEPIFNMGITPENTEANEFALFMRIKAKAQASTAGGADLLIHQDAHSGNLNVTESGQITLFDFDDCGYGTAVHDIAIVLFYRLMSFATNIQAEARRFLDLFLKGYERHCTLPTGWATGVDAFLSFREFEIWWLLLREPLETWFQSEVEFMVDRKERIRAGVPFLGTAFTEL